MVLMHNDQGREVLLTMVNAIQENKSTLGDIDGLIGDGDHGMNMNKGFTVFQENLGERQISLSDGLMELGNVLLNRIGGSMGPIYGTLFISMAEKAEGESLITLPIFVGMLEEGISNLYQIIDARPGDKTLIDTLDSAIVSLRDSVTAGRSFDAALEEMKRAAERGCSSTVDMVAKYGRSARLGERSRGVPDAGATSCYMLLKAMAEGIQREMRKEAIA